jgi:hypothetical protein
MREAFLVNERDAVDLAGSEACSILNIDTETLLTLCAGFPYEAKQVLVQLDVESALVGVDIATLTQTGIRARVLRELGFTLPHILRQMPSAAPVDVIALGFTL